MSLRWGAKITDTAKLSVKHRHLVRDRARDHLDELRRLRNRALLYTSPSSVTTFAKEVPLPEPSDDEGIVLFNSWCRVDSPWRVEYEDRLARERQDDNLWFTASDDENDIDSGVTFSDDESNASGDKQPDNEEDLGMDSGHTCNLPQQLQDRQKECLKHESPDEERSTHQSEREESEWASIKANTAEIQNELFLARKDTFAWRLKKMLDDFEMTIFGDVLQNENPGVANMIEAAMERNVNNPNRKMKYPVSAQDLMQLEIAILDTQILVKRIKKGMQQVKDSLSNREKWHRMRDVHGPLTMVMKGKGRGSSLADRVSVDEPWPDPVDSWGVPEVMLKKERPQIYDGRQRLSRQLAPAFL